MKRHGVKRNSDISRRADRERRSAAQILAAGVAWTLIALAVCPVLLVGLVIVLSPSDGLDALGKLVEIVRALSEALQALANAVPG